MRQASLFELMPCRARGQIVNAMACAVLAACSSEPMSQADAGKQNEPATSDQGAVAKGATSGSADGGLATAANGGTSETGGAGGSGRAASPAAARSSPSAAAGSQNVGGVGASAAGAEASSDLPVLCSGCASEPKGEADLSIHLHHVHMNVADRERSTRFYETHLAAQRVSLNGVSEALHAQPVLLLLDQTASAPKANLPTGIQHIGWGSEDVAAWFEHAHADGVEPDARGNTFFNTNETPTIGAPGSGPTLLQNTPACFPVPDAFSYIYVLGPDQERIEIWSGADLRVNHLHFTTADLATTVDWYQRFLGQQIMNSALFASFFIDDILFFFEPIGTSADYQPTDDHVLAHVAFAVSDLPTWFARAKEQQLEIVAEPAAVHGFNSFFVRGPDGVLIELVQAAPSDELCP